MSGDAGGFVLGVLALAALPYVLAGATAVAVGYGVFQLGKVIARKINEDQGVKKIEIDNCSTALSAMYGSINSAIENANSLQKEYDNALQTQVQTLETEIKNMELTNNADIKVFEEKLKQKKAELEQLVSMSTSKTKQKVVGDIKQVVSESSKAFETAKKNQAALVNWKSTLASDKFQQQAVAAVSMKDAKSTIRLLENLRESCTNQAFRDGVAVLVSSMETAEINYNNGLYEAAVSNANTIVTQGAITAIEMALDEYERNQAMYEFEARLEIHKGELESKRSFTVPFMGEDVEVDLNDFSQGMYEKALKVLEERLSDLHKNAQKMSVLEMKNGIENCDIIETEDGREISVARIIDVAQEKVHAYYEKLGILDLIAEHMVSQGYKLEWARCVGDDMTQKLVINFSNPVLKNQVSVSIDTEGSIEDFCKCALELSCFYDNDKPFSEHQKKQLRDAINNHLYNNGYQGGLSCIDSVGQSSNRTDLQTEGNVVATKPVSVYN